MDDFPGRLPGMENWRRHPKMEHRFYSPESQEVDVLPVGAAAIARGFIEWPSGHRMSLAGFDLVFEHSEAEQVGEVELRIPSAPVVALLKMRSWLDRPTERRKDLQDLAHLLAGYIGDDADRRWSDEAIDSGVDFEHVSRFILGFDLGRMARPQHLPHIEGFIAKAPPAALAAHGPPRWLTAEDAEKAISVFLQGLHAGRSSQR